MLTYKFYWFLALIGRIALGETTIRKNDLFREMVSHAWYTVNYFHVSFGKQDKLQYAIEQVRAGENLTIEAERRNIFKRLSTSSNKATLRELRRFNSELPHRFLSPWFNAGNIEQAYFYFQSFYNQCPGLTAQNCHLLPGRMILDLN